MKETCPFANEGCKYFSKSPPVNLRGVQEHGCFTDIHHPYYPETLVRHLGMVVAKRLKLNYNPAIRMNNNEAGRLCRNLHDKEHREIPFNLPTNTTIKQFIRGQSNGSGTRTPGEN